MSLSSPLYVNSTVSGGGGGGGLFQTKFINVTMDETTTSHTFVNLLSLAITLAAGHKLIIDTTESSSNAEGNREHSFRILIDGVPAFGGGFASHAANAKEATGAALVLEVSGLAAGLHTVVLQWKTSGGTMQIRPVSNPDTEHASLLLEEVSV